MKIGEFYQNTLKMHANSPYITEIVLRSIIVKIEKLDSMSDFFFKFDNEMTAIGELNKCIDEILKGVPYQYVLNEAYFFGLNFYVDKNVLIPRMETEELVQMILSDFKNSTNMLFVADIGTGSGCIAVSIKKNVTNSRVFASDISKSALQVASINALNNQEDIQFLHGDMLKPYIEQKLLLDIIVSNPPYIQNINDVDKIVLEHEPHLALFAKAKGIEFYIEIFKDAPKVLKNGGAMYFEINYDQKDLLTEEIKKTLPNSQFEFFKDSFGLWRMLKINYKE